MASAKVASGKSRSARGQVLVEFALVLPLLCLLVIGLVEFGVLFYDKAMVDNASREGARTGIRYRTDSGGNYTPYTPAEIDTVVKNYLQPRLITFGGTGAITTNAPRTGTSPFYGGDGYVDVQVTYEYKYLALPGLMGIGKTITIGSETIMRLE
jgi:Flp pilus assembly protein TadG